jgi:thioredoxin 1
MLTIYRYTADWCGPCKMMAPVIEKLVNDYSSEDSGVQILSLDVDDLYNKEQAGKHGVRSIPTLVFEKDGVEVDRTVGGKQYDEISKLILKHK